MIEIGKQYRLNIRPNPEFSCPKCGMDIGENSFGSPLNGQIVTIDSKLGEDRFARCGSASRRNGCGARYPTQEGLYLLK